MFSSYRNQLVDLQSKPTDWFLYDGNIGRQKVKENLSRKNKWSNKKYKKMFESALSKQLLLLTNQNFYSWYQ